MGKTKNRQLAIFLAGEVASQGKFALPASMGLYNFGAVALREALALSYHTDPNVRYTAVNLLEDIALPPAVKRIIELVDDPDELVRETARYSLEEMAAKAGRRDRSYL
jgi:HEAT repeat protein